MVYFLGISFWKKTSTNIWTKAFLPGVYGRIREIHHVRVKKNKREKRTVFFSDTFLCIDSCIYAIWIIALGRDKYTL